MIWDIAKWFVVAIAAYLLGNISFGVILSRLIAKKDVRSQGSGGTGTTNIFRLMGMKASLTTLLGDLLKAFAAGMLGHFLAGELGGLLGGLMAVAGHNWPVFLKFKGGKGIAATAGAILGNHPVFALILLPLALISIRLIGVVSIVSLCAVTVNMILTFVFYWGNWPACAFGALLAIMAFVCHRANIRRILNGTEKNNRLNFDKKQSSM